MEMNLNNASFYKNDQTISLKILEFWSKYKKIKLLSMKSLRSFSIAGIIIYTS